MLACLHIFTSLNMWRQHSSQHLKHSHLGYEQDGLLAVGGAVVNNPRSILLGHARPGLQQAHDGLEQALGPHDRQAVPLVLRVRVCAGLLLHTRWSLLDQ